MRTTLDIEEKLFVEAGRLSGIRERAALVRAALEALIAQESARQLASLGGKLRNVRSPRRRRRNPQR